MAVPTLQVRGSLLIDGKAVNDVPIEAIAAWIRDRMPEYGGRSASLKNRVLAVKAETGSGKSTVLPVEVFRIVRDKRIPPHIKFHGAGVLCTQPRVLTAIALARDVTSKPWNPDMLLDSTVGYLTGPLKRTIPSGLIYATAGVLAAQLRGPDGDGYVMNRYRFIIVDEAHERSLDSDFMLLTIRNFYRRNEGNPRLPFLILASATFDPYKYAAYFGVDNVFEVLGHRPYEITPHYPPHDVRNYLDEAAKVAISIHESNPKDRPTKADILIFVPGASEIEAVSALLTDANAKYAKGDLGPMLILKIDSKEVNKGTKEFDLVFAESLPKVFGRDPVRRVIVSTVVAETGLTINTLRYVIDSGWSRTREEYPPWGAGGLTTRPAPRTRIIQRKGRVGRLFPGDFHPLYTKDVWDELDKEQLPDIITGGVGAIFLALIEEQQRQKKIQQETMPEFRVEDVGLLDVPTPEAFLSAQGTAIATGFVSLTADLGPRCCAASSLEASSTVGYGLTPMGEVAARFSRTSMEGIRVLMAGLVWGHNPGELVTAVALFDQSKKGFVLDHDKGTDDALAASVPGFVGEPGDAPSVVATRARLLLLDEYAELVLIFAEFMRRVDSSISQIGGTEAVSAWCLGVNLNQEAMLALAHRREELGTEMLMSGLDPFRCGCPGGGGLRSVHGLVNAPDRATLVEALTSFKRCLYDGLRARVLTLADGAPEPGIPSDAGRYRNKQLLRVKVPQFVDYAHARAIGLQVGAPRWIMSDTLRLSILPGPSQGHKKILYGIKPGLMSALDPYIAPDLALDEGSSPPASLQKSPPKTQVSVCADKLKLYNRVVDEMMRAVRSADVAKSRQM